MKFKLGNCFTILRTLGASYPPRKGMRVVCTNCSPPVCGTVVDPEYLEEDLKIRCCAIELDEGEGIRRLPTHTCNGRVPSKRGWIVSRENWNLLKEIQDYWDEPV